jgi:glycosyltransferase involved in cell wall biosynthesis
MLKKEQVNKKTVLVLVPSYYPGFKAGGPNVSIKNLVEKLKSHFNFYILTSDRDLGDEVPYKNIKKNTWIDFNGSKIFYSEPGIKFFINCYQIMRDRKCDIIYFNSFFHPKFTIFPLLLKIIKKAKEPVLIAPRGEFSKDALRIKFFKKFLYILFFKYLILNSKLGINWQASSNFELCDIKKIINNKGDIFFNAPNIVSRNLFVAQDLVNDKLIRHLSPREKSKAPNFSVIFFSRISPKKNLVFALKILSMVNLPILFDIYGPIEDPIYWKKCQKLILSIPKNVTIRYQGIIEPNILIDTIRNYDLFFFPTYGENFGHVIYEALFAGLTLLISDQTPWRNLFKMKVGFDLSLDNEKAFIDALHYQFKNKKKYLHIPDRQFVLNYKYLDKYFPEDQAIKNNISMFNFLGNL